jgi:glycosyltransferase involved in cell wall biosynthesis
MLKIVQLTPFYFPHIGGVEHHVEQLNAKLLKTKLQTSISVITLQHDAALPLIDSRKEVAVHRMPMADTNNKLIFKFSLWLQIWKLRQLLFEADVIQIHDIFWWLIPVLPFISRQKVFITFHGYEGNTLPKWNQIFWKRVAEKFTNGSIAIGEFQRKWYGIEPSYISYGAAESSSSVKLRMTKKDKRQKTEDKRLVFIGRLETDNGIMKYLEAVKELRGAKLKLDIYGDGTLRDTAEEYVRKYKLPVKFYGFTEAAAKQLPNYDIAFVSRYLSIIEALGVGIPVIAQYNNELQLDYLQLAPFAKWITIAQDSKEMSESLRKNKVLASEAQAWAKKQTWEKVVEVYLILWKSKKQK